MPAALLSHRDLFTPRMVLTALWDCRGERQGLTARELVFRLTERHRSADERQLRRMIEALRTAGHPVCGHPARGYFLATSAAELDRTCEFLFARSMTSLRQVAALKRVSLPDLRGQLGMPLRSET